MSWFFAARARALQPGIRDTAAGDAWLQRLALPTADIGQQHAKGILSFLQISNPHKLVV